MSKPIEINNCKFNVGRVTTQRGNNLKFKSTDGKDYKVSCGKDNAALSKDLPLDVFADNRIYLMDINKDADKKDYTCEAKRIPPEKCDPDDQSLTPAMIIRVE